jgi:heat shock protein HslJ
MRNATLLLGISLVLVAGCAGETSKAPEPAAAPAPFPTEPPAGAWRLIAFGDATEVSEPEVTLQVEEDGNFAGTSGCNRFSGRWTRKDGWVGLGPIAATKMTCPPEIMAVEDRYLADLRKTAGWRPHVDGVVLVDASGDPLLVFERSP